MSSPDRIDARVLAVLWVGTLVIAFVIGRKVFEHDTAMPLVHSEAHARPADVAAPRTEAVHRDRALSADEIRRIVREELETHAVAPSSEVGADAPADTPERTEAAVRARTTANTIVNEARSRGRWTEADRTAFLQVAFELAPEDYDAAMETLLPALNRREIALETSGPPI